MKYSEIEAQIRELATQQPRGWQAELSRQLGISTASVAQKLTANSPRQIPPDQLHQYLDALGLEVVIRPKGEQ
jgi:hypothetical protein